MKNKSLHHSDLDSPKKDVSPGRLTRRTFLNTAGIAVVGGLATAAGGSLYAKEETGQTGPQEAPVLPWKYSKLDPLEAGKRGYENYLLKGG